MNKESKRTILKSIELFFKNHKEDKPKDPEIKDNNRRSILQVIDKPENISDRTTDTTFPVPSEPIMNESSFKTTQPDYDISDLTKKEDISNSDVQPPLEDEININSILNNLDDKLNEDCKSVLNILTTRSAKDNFRESALVEFNVNDKSYVMSMIIEKEEDTYKYSLKSSYGKEIYSKNTDLNHLNETIYYPFKAIALRSNVSSVLNEKDTSLSKQMIDKATELLLKWFEEEEPDSLDKDEYVDALCNELESEFNVTITRAQEKELEELFWSELEKDMHK